MGACVCMLYVYMRVPLPPLPTPPISLCDIRATRPCITRDRECAWCCVSSPSRSDIPMLIAMTPPPSPVYKTNSKNSSKKRAPSSPQLDRYVKTFKSSFLTPLLKDVSRAQRAQIPAIAAF